jgi:folate-dependent tRNA-U54 methylase TrmFO/GidA
MASLYALKPSRARDFQPMNANYGLFPPVDGPQRGRARREALGLRAGRDAAAWRTRSGIVELADPIAESAPSA